MSAMRVYWGLWGEIRPNTLLDRLSDFCGNFLVLSQRHLHPVELLNVRFLELGSGPASEPHYQEGEAVSGHEILFVSTVTVSA